MRARFPAESYASNQIGYGEQENYSEKAIEFCDFVQK